MPTQPLTSLDFRHLSIKDLSHCSDLSEDRGWPREEHKWGLLLSAGLGYGLDAPDGAGLAACCVVTSYGTPGREPSLHAIGMVLVAARYARQGLGRRLMAHVLRETHPVPVTLHATPNGQPLYEQLGFQVTGRSEMLLGNFIPDPGPADASIRQAVAEDLPEILRLDHEVFGADRTSMLARLPAFADHLLVAEAGGRLTGYLAAWPNGETHVVGPLVSQDSGTAQSLISALGARTERPLRTDVDERHGKLLAWLKDHGLRTVATNAVMVKGAGELPGDWTRRFAPLTVAAG
ncbi:GNAT family N-acetyltransferase [Streptomyces sp. NPDC006879]|uniref:GNAT family N-acetyltransferase n=1 Tax=Streptomyces sp. NPDC006879 TaxID=3364767 RepID=UPI00369CC341